ncbi:putative cytochrome P450 [Periconia macrospinosa]|uniref:Putative cytochrome P450 n=1 Tax=Periconia macrospinosa TaxID=97972 RepID=A0A2V1E1U8_9PLEO|nr:putative cytochrome P450 [Periconia macrospinosa]
MVSEFQFHQLDFWRSKSLLWTGLFVLVSLVVKYVSPKKAAKNNLVPVGGVPPGMGIKEARGMFYHNAQTMLLEGYNKFKGSPYYIPTPLGERMMIPPKYVEELKNEPMEDVDFVGTFFEMFEGKYTTMGSRSQLHPRVTRLQLNQYMGSVLGPVREEITKALEYEVPPTDDWSEVALAGKFPWIIARASSRMFGGKPLAADTEWLHAILDFAADGFVGAQKIKQYPELLRPVVAPFIPELRRISKHHAAVNRSVKRILDSRKYEPGKISKADGDNPSDFLQWMMEDAKGEEQHPDFLATILLKISFAAIHTTAATLMQLVFDLCERPEYIAPLRAEMEAVLSEHPELNKVAFTKMRKLDSFMKESIRFNPLLLITFQRIVHRDYTLADGFFIPAGSWIGSPSQSIAMDPNLFPDPEKFDGFRHEKMLNAVAPDPAAAGRTKWASANLDNMAFGYGRHACPGRFFADYEIKLILVHLLMTYDFKSPPGQEARPQNMNVEIQMVPNHEAKIAMRRRRP